MIGRSLLGALAAVTSRPAIAILNRPQTIRFRIVSLVVLLLVPLVMVFIWGALNFAASKRDLIELQRLDITNRLSSLVDREISMPMGMLVGLAGADDLAKGNFRDFRRQATLLASQPNIDRIWAFRRSGSIIGGSPDSNESDETSLPPGMIDRVFDGRRYVSMVEGVGMANARVVIAVPVLSGARVGYGVAARIRIGGLSSKFAEAGMDPKWVAAIVDRSGRFIARSIDPETRVGQVSRPELGIAARGASPTGVFENTTYEGVRMLNAFRRSDLTDWTTVVAVPRTELDAPMWRAMEFVALGGSVILLATLGLAWMLAERISAPVRNLSQFAASLAEGRPYSEVPHHIEELDEVRRELERAMAHSARLAALVASSGDAIMSIDLDGTIRTWNKGAEDLFGYSAEDIVGKPKTLIVPQDKIAEFEAERKGIMSGDSFRVETVRLRRDGTRVHVSLDAAPVRRADGRIIAISSIIHDISDRKAAEEHMRFLMRELAHRSKNQLAIIQSIAGQTARDATGIDEFMTKFRHRLQGLAASHDLLARQEWKGVSIADLVEGQLAVFADVGSRENISISGPDISLGPTSAEAIGLALHELATNSVKYGSLSTPGGHISLGWSVKRNGDGQSLLKLEWTETGGPEVKPPARKGFGSQVIERLAATSVGGKSRIDYSPQGVHWELEFPVTSRDGQFATRP